MAGARVGAGVRVGGEERIGEVEIWGVEVGDG